MSGLPKVQRGGFAQGLARFLGVVGQAPEYRLSDLIQPTFDVQVARDYPFQQFCFGVAGKCSVAAVAAEFGYATLTPARATVLEVRRLIFSHGAAAAQTFAIRYLTAANVASIGIGATAAGLTRLNASDPSTSAAPEVSGAFTGFGSDAGSIGNSFLNISCPATSQVYVDFNPALFCWNVPETNFTPLSIGVRCATLFQAWEFGMQGREWLVP